MTDQTTQTTIARENQTLAHNYHPLPVVLTRGEGIWVWDTEGNKYLDFLSAYSAVSAGHLHPRIKKALIDQLDHMDLPSRAFYNDKLGLFAEALCGLTGMDRMMPMNTGAEAVETGIKAARRWGYDVKGIPADQARIIVCENNYHGRTTTLIGFSSEPEYKRSFGPFDGSFDTVPFGDAKALEAAITPNTCAFLMEPIQAECGIIVPPEGFLKKAQEVCRQHNVLLMLDEIQTGMGRTGTDFCFQHELDTPPDGLMLGKAIGGGIYPVSAFLARKDVMDVFVPGSHGSTFGGNPVAAAIGLESLALLKDENLTERSKNLGGHLKEQLEEMRSPLVSDIRGKGLLIGMEIDPSKARAREVCERLKDKGLLCKETHETVVRFAPPLVIEKEDINWAVEQVHSVLKDMA